MPAFVPRAYIPKPIVTLNATDVVVADSEGVFVADNVEDALFELYEQIYALPITPKHTFVLKCTGEAEALTVSSGVYNFRLPYNFHHIQEIRASLVTPQTSGSLVTVDIKRNGSSVFSLPLTIDNGEKSSLTAAAPHVIYTDYWEDDDEITVDITQIGDGTAEGLKLYFVGLEEEEVIIPDPYAADVTLYLKFEGAAESTTIVDSATVPATITSAGSFKLTNTRKVGASALLSSLNYTSPTPGYIVADNSGAFDFGTADFCIDMWYQHTVAGTNGYIFGTVGTLGAIGSTSQYGLQLRADAGSGFRITYYSGTTAYTSSYSGALTMGTWYRLRLIREAGVFKLYIDGSVGITFSSANAINNHRYMIFLRSYTGDAFVCYCRIDEFRLTLGESREPYTYPDY